MAVFDHAAEVLVGFGGRGHDFQSDPGGQARGETRGTQPVPGEDEGGQEHNAEQNAGGQGLPEGFGVLRRWLG